MVNPSITVQNGNSGWKHWLDLRSGLRIKTQTGIMAVLEQQ